MIEAKKLHAKFSASGSERWLNCPGSIALSKKAPPQPDNVYALEGTDAHTCLETIMMNSERPGASAAMLKKRFPVAMVNYAIETYEHILALMPDNTILLCETRVDLEFVEPDMFGTVDAAIVDLFGILWVIDYKYGAGRLVLPKENTQMIYYALGIAHKYHFNFSKVRLAIAQPRIVHKDGFFRTWDMEVPQLMEWTEKFKTGVKACKEPDAPLKPGRWCFFCPAQSICPAIGEQNFEDAQNDFSDDVDQISEDVAFELEQL